MRPAIHFASLIVPVMLALAPAFVSAADSTQAPLPPSVTVGTETDSKHKVMFTFTDAAAQEVYLVGSFNDWNRTKDEMTSAPGGVFTAEMDLEDGDYEYRFYIDGKKYSADPLNKAGFDDEARGGRVSVLRIGPPRLSEADEALSRTRELAAGITGHDDDKLLAPRTKVSDVKVTSDSVSVSLSKEALLRPWRPATVAALKDALAPAFTSSTLPLNIVVNKRPLEDFIPPFYRTAKGPRDGMSKASPHADAPLRRNMSSVVPTPSKGLAGRNIVVWASHGLLFDKERSQRWEWQRPRLFTTAEDLLTMSIVNSYLLPMLENAGGTVFNCRERDFQTNEVVVDDGDRDTTSGRFEIRGKVADFPTSSAKGFRNGIAPLADGVNPHREGTTHEASTVRGRFTASANWIPSIPADGDYAVYVSYASSPRSATDARYLVHHAGGTTSFTVNQRMAGNTWVYLGTFHFKKGRQPSLGSVELTNQSDTAGLRISADAVKFGGGMGSVQRGGSVSGYPRYAEAARYWFQYCGVDPKAIYAYGRIAGNEYTEDYVSRSEYANYLMGAPRGPAGNRAFTGLGVPVDLSFALHTDAGVTTGIVGTLGIHTVRGGDGKVSFPDGRDRLLNRDLADMIQTQVVGDLRARYTSDWTRRDLMDSGYAESRQPLVPAALVELLSHQNYDDMKFALDPRFKFDVARAIYKGMLRFLAAEYGLGEPVIAPLSPKGIEARAVAADRVRVSWQPVLDPLEPSAAPTGFVVYRRTNDGGFDNGILVTSGNSVELTVPKASGDIQGFRVTAVNEGGESMPSSVASVRIGGKDAKRVLIVDAFDRVCGPAMVTIGQGKHEGADRSMDRGVGDKWMVGLTGDQYDMDRGHAWEGDSPYSNDNPGHGASSADMEARQEIGNSHDVVAAHADALSRAGWAFDTVAASALGSDLAAITTPTGALGKYAMVDWVLGEQRTTMPPPAHDGKTSAGDRMKPEFKAWPAAHQKLVRDYLAGGGRLLVSGAYVAADLVTSPLASPEDRAFLKDVLRCTYLTDHATKTNNVLPSRTKGAFSRLGRLHISSGPGEDGVYGVENAGGIDGLPKEAPAALRYADGAVGAAVTASTGKGRRVVLAFPLESVVGAAQRAALMKAAMDYLEK